MNENDDDLVIRSLASVRPEAADRAEHRRARFKASLAAIETDPRERARIDRIAAEAGITDQDETAVTTGGATAASGASAGLKQVTEALTPPAIDMSVIEEARKRQEQVSLILQNTLQMQDELIAQGEKMQEAMAQIEEHAAAAEQVEPKPRSRGTTLSQITMPGIVATLIAATALLASRPYGVASIAALAFAGVVVLYAVFYVLVFFMSAWTMARHSKGGAERVLRLLLGSLSIEERLAEARASTISRALRNTPPDDSLNLQVGSTENPDIIELTRRAASRRALGRNVRHRADRDLAASPRKR